MAIPVSGPLDLVRFIMIVCVCKSVSDRAIRALLCNDVAPSFDELQFELGVATCCGKCEPSIRGLMARSGACASLCGVEHPPQSAPVVFYDRPQTG